MACGNTNHEIAARLEISWRTVRKHVEHIFVKLMAVETRAAAAAKALGTHSR
ncbi:MAG: LuxR C-terminal-related transcriptional regulator [Candidatus Eremiobacteraeota bacterium]|nr:LuxR C-terminal-related transcriptional regulator [Candidatus Eremiobacteraeota bacterium]